MITAGSPGARSECIDENAALALVDGALASAARTQVERHLGSCDACRELVAELARGFDEDAMPSPDTERLPYAAVAAVSHGGKYRVEAEIGSGSAGTVYRARDERTREVVALKIVTDPSLAHRFAREATTLARLDHPAIVRYIAHGETQGGMYLAMEWLEGEDLEQRIRRGPLGWQAARVLALRLSEALAHAHALGLVHRDLSPRNVFLPGGRLEDAKLLDFGLVRVPDAHLLERTASQAILGTPYYMAPEQVRDPKRVDARADLFGLGVLLYEMTSGRRPFDGADLFALWVNIVDAAPPSLGGLAPGTPAAFLAIVDALLAKNPDARPASALYVHRALATMEVSFAPTAPMLLPIESPLRRAAPPLPAAMTMPAGYVFSSGPPQALTAPPPPVPSPPPRSQTSPGAGIFMAAGAGIMSLVAAAIVLVYVLTHGAHAPPPVEDEPVASPSPSPAGVLPATEAKDEPHSDPAPRRDPPPEPDPAEEGTSSLNCAFGTKTERGRTYSPASPMTYAVIANGACQLDLADCTITGESSLLLNGEAKVTLRRCHVAGQVMLNGGATLVLEGTQIAHLKNVGGRVVVR